MVVFSGRTDTNVLLCCLAVRVDVVACTLELGKKLNSNLLLCMSGNLLLVANNAEDIDQGV